MLRSDLRLMRSGEVSSLGGGAWLADVLEPEEEQALDLYPYDRAVWRFADSVADAASHEMETVLGTITLDDGIRLMEEMERELAAGLHRLPPQVEAVQDEL